MKRPIPSFNGAIDSAGQSAVAKAGVFRRLGRPIALAAAALATTLLMTSTASAQLYTSTTSTGNWLNNTGTAGRWSTTSSGPFDGNFVSGSNASFTTAGNYTFDRLVTTGSATLGNITTVDNVNIGFTNSSGQTLNFGGAGGAVRTIDLGAGSTVDFGTIAITAGNGITKTGAGTLVLTGGAYTGGFTLNAGNVITRAANALGTGALTINGGAIGSGTTTFVAPTRSGGAINVGGNFQIGIAGSPAVDAGNMTFGATGNGFNLNNGDRTITLGSSGSMSFAQAITNGSLTLNRLASGSAGQFTFSGSNSFTALTLDSVKLNATTSNFALGSGTVTLTGANATTLNIQGARTYFNTFTIANSAGTKTITNSVANATIQGTITNNDSTGGLVIGATTGRTLTIGAIDGNGTTGVTFGGGSLVGTVLMTGTGTYTGNTAINGSILRMGGSGRVAGTNLSFTQTAGGVTPTFDLNGTVQTVAGLDDSTAAGIIRTTLAGAKLIVGDSNNSTFQGTIISGNSLALEKVGTGKLTLTGANTYTNGTTITAGELEVSSQSLRGDVVNNATLTFNQAFGDGTFSGDISGSGSFFKIGDNTLTLTGANTYSGGTQISAGSLIGDTDALQGAITNNAAVTFEQSADGTYAGAMSGNGSLTKAGAGAVTLTGSNTYSGGTTVTEGGLNGTTLSLQGAISTAASTTVTFNQSTSGTYSGVMTGDGSLTKTGSGTLLLGGNNTYSGGTIVSAGSLIGTTSTLRGAIINNAAVTFHQHTSGTYSQVMSGSGSLTKAGSGWVSLTGTNNYSGATVVDSGELNVNGSIASSEVTVNSGGSLSGSGTVGGISGAGSINPGNSPGILTAPWIDPSDGMFLNFEITGIKPEYSLASGSVNDVLHLTSASPFVAAMNSGNQINVYFNMASFDMTQAYRAGIYTDEQADFTNMVSGASFNYYVQDNAGTINYNGVLYSALSSAVTVSTVLDTANFAGSTVNGRVMQFTIVPETSSALFAAFGTLFLLRRRRKS